MSGISSPTTFDHSRHSRIIAMDLCRILFWNVKRKDLTPLVCELAISTQADVIVLLEFVAQTVDVLAALRSQVHKNFLTPQHDHDGRFQCFSRVKSLDLSEFDKTNRASYRKLIFQDKVLALGLIHGPDIRNNDEYNQIAYANELATDLNVIKSQHNYHRIMLLGDFNLNPYDRAMNLHSGLNAMMTRVCASEQTRQVDGKKYDLYYNPMWSLLGDNSEGPPGTNYDRSKVGPFGWSLFDQVLIHHSIVHYFDSVRILRDTGKTSLVDQKGRPDKKHASDHLPILVTLKGASDE